MVARQSWIANAKDRTKFLVGSGVDAAFAASAGTVSKVKTAAKKAAAGIGEAARKGQRKGPQPARYLDPKTGASWSGRGPAPASKFVCSENRWNIQRDN
jgi:DNA-binding protein H-NS